MSWRKGLQEPAGGAQIDRVDFGSRRFGSVRAGAATMQIDVIRKAPEASLFGEDAE